MFMKINENRLNMIIQECINNVILEMSPRPLKTLEQFILEAQVVHGNKYDYSKVQYSGTDVPVTIICPKHGEFPQTPHHHLQGEGCPKCAQSHLENETAKVLNSKGIENEWHYTPKWLSGQHLDFYIPKYRIGIECQGIQHYEPREYFGGENYFLRVQQLDAIKKEKCDNANVALFYIKYTEIKNIETIVDNIINSYLQ